MIAKNSFLFYGRVAGSLLCLIVLLGDIRAQTISLDDLKFFRHPSKNWQLIGEVSADLTKHDVFVVKPGKGILVNLPNGNDRGALETVIEHGDLELELDYMMAKESNSGIYLQGRYEIQLFDSWLVKKVTENDNGSIYGRQSARQNASRAAGLWQHMKVVFRAPRFNEEGKKIENARIVSLYLNGVLIHDNVELPWQTAGAVQANEVAKGALLIQGDHGEVAFRNIRFSLLDTASPVLSKLHYEVFSGRFDKIPDFKTLKAVRKGSVDNLGSGIAQKTNGYLAKFTGTIQITQPGEYSLFLVADAGFSRLRVNGKDIFEWNNPDWRPAKKSFLPAGDIPIEIIYSKTAAEPESSLGLTIYNPATLPVFSGDPWAKAARYDHEGPIYKDAETPVLLRSFMDIAPDRSENKTFRVTHAVSVGHPDAIHYTYDLDHGSVVQAWRDQFLETTPMWRGRGDGSAQPRGVLSYLDTPGLLLNRLPNTTAQWVSDTTGAHYEPDGYSFDANDLPTFKYRVFGAKVSDKLRLIETGEGLHRALTITNPPADLYCLLATGSKIESQGNGIYSIGDHLYYIKLDPSDSLKPIIRNGGQGQELILSIASGKLSYSIWF